MKNLPNDFTPNNQTLWEALEKIEAEDNTVVQTAEDLTIAQVGSPISEVEVENDSTVVQTAEDLTIAQVGSPISEVEVENDSTVVQTAEDLTIAQVGSPISEVEVENDNTVVRHSNLTIHNSAEQKVNRAMSPLSPNWDRTPVESEMPKSLHSSTLTIVSKNRAHIRLFQPNIRDTFRTLGSFPSRFTSITRRFFNSIWRKIDPLEPQSNFHLDKQPTVRKTLEQPSSKSLNHATYNAVALDEQPSSKQYHKKLRELDICRLDYAKELAKNGKFRKAIAQAEQISEMSCFFKDAQMLIQSWKQF